MNWFFKVLLHVFSCIFLGCVVIALHFCSSEHFKEIIAYKAQQQFERDYDCVMTCRVDHIDWLFLKLHVTDVVIKPRKNTDRVNNHWSIEVEKLVVSVSWLTLLKQFYFDIHLDFDHMILFEKCSDRPTELLNFLQKLFAAPVSSLIVYSGFSLHNSLLHIKKTLNDASLMIPLSGSFQLQNSFARFQLYVQDGCANYPGVCCLSDLTGSFMGQLPYNGAMLDVIVQLQLNYVVEPVALQGGKNIAGFVAGGIEKGVGHFVLKSNDGTIMVDAIDIVCKKKECFCDMNVKASTDLFKYVGSCQMLADIQGFAHAQVHADLYNIVKTLEINFLFDELKYKNALILPKGKIAVVHNGNGFSGTVYLDEKSVVDVKCFIDPQDWHLLNIHEFMRIPCKIITKNMADVALFQESSWIVKGGDALLKIVIDQQGNVHGSYDVLVMHEKLCEKKRSSGRFAINDGNLVVNSVFDDIEYEIKCRLYPEFMFEKFEGRKKNKTVFAFKRAAKKQTAFEGTIAFALLQDMVPKMCKQCFAQDDNVLVSGSLQDNKICVDLAIKNVCMRIPNIYNIVQDVHALCLIDIHDKKIVLKDIDVSLYEGSISCKQATLFFDDIGTCSFVHVPLMLHDVMFSWDRGIYSLMSGRIFLNKKNIGHPFHVEGTLVLQKAELKENLFSNEFKELLVGGLFDTGIKGSTGSSELNWTYDISLFTKDLLHIKTSFMSAQAVVDLVLKGSFKDPQLAGNFKLVAGELDFPYKSLEITQGQVLFIPEQPIFEPIIELVAKNRLKRFGISMHAWGSIMDPHVEFQSEPYLTEEQIVSLLLMGIENNTLGILLPAFLMQKLQEIIFGPAMSMTKLQSVFDRLLKSLRYFRFLPQFTNHTGRGGLRGTFEIDASERLHGKIDTNFMQIEDTKFDIDYALTDDVTLRAQKDGPSTYGGEIELRWKFS